MAGFLVCALDIRGVVSEDSIALQRNHLPNL